MKFLLHLLLLSVPLAVVRSDCRHRPFDIETALVPYENEELHCDGDEALYVAEIVANTINYVVVKTFRRMGVVKSHTRICKDGEFLIEHIERFSLFGGLRRQLGRQNQFIYRGSGYCRFCEHDNGDARMLLETADLPASIGMDENSTMVTDQLSSETEDERLLLTKLQEKMRRKKRLRLKKDDLNDYRVVRGYGQNKEVRDRKFGLKWNERRNNAKKNGFGFPNIFERNKPTMDLGVFKIGKTELYYYNHYYADMKEELHLSIMGKIVGNILYYIFNKSSLNKKLCTYNKLKDVVVNITDTQEYSDPVCQLPMPYHYDDDELDSLFDSIYFSDDNFW